MEHQSSQPKRIRWGLQTRMSLSYLSVSMCTLLLVEILLFTTVVVLFMSNEKLDGKPLHISGMVFGMLFIGLIGLVVLAPTGALFGVIFTRGPIQRIQRLILATSRFAAGDYQQRVPITQHDEISQLEQQFNTMAEQLIESIRKQQELTERNVRMEERAKIEQELQTARLIQHSLLPKSIPDYPGWQLTTCYQPARVVGGDLYDFHTFSDGRLGLIIGDVADKGVAAAIVMASTCSMLRAAAQAFSSPGEVLKQVNDLLYTTTPDRIFVTCFFAILDPKSGTLQYANAGHDLPYLHMHGKVEELRATGMPLGLMPGMYYEEREITLAPGASILFYSDGLVEAHNPQGEMFGFPRLKSLLTETQRHLPLINFLLDDLKQFTQEDWEQEDDITLIALQRMLAEVQDTTQDEQEEMLLNCYIASEPGNEQIAMKQIAGVVSPLNLTNKQLANLKTATAEAVMNAMEHGNGYQSTNQVLLQASASKNAVTVRIHDQGQGEALPDPATITVPDLTAKLAGQQTPRGWGLFLIKSLVDELHIHKEDAHQVIELKIFRQSRLPDPPEEKMPGSQINLDK